MRNEEWSLHTTVLSRTLYCTFLQMREGMIIWHMHVSGGTASLFCEIMHLIWSLGIISAALCDTQARSVHTSTVRSKLHSVVHLSCQPVVILS